MIIKTFCDDAKKTCIGEKPRILFFFIQRILFKRSLEIIEPIGLMALSAFIEEKGYTPGVFTGNVTEAVSLLKGEVLKQSVSAVGLYCDFENRPVVESFSKYVKENFKIPVLVGGPQAFALGRDFILSSRCDAVVRGEGEYTLLELLEYFIHGKGNLTDIAGITFLNDRGDLISTQDRDLIEDLDSLPFQRISHSLTEHKKNFAVITGRGCPFNCAFCYQSGIKKRVRLRSVSHVMGELRGLFEENPHVPYVWFADDTFTLNPGRIDEFCKELSSLRKERDFVWFCDGHPSLLVRWPRMIKQMVDAGLVRMQIGIESGSEKVIDSYRKETSLEQIEEVIRLAGEAGLPQICGNIIVGGAFESLKTLEETGEYVNKLLTMAPGILDISFTIFTPFPGTSITSYPGEFGMTILDPDGLTSVGDYPVAVTDELELHEIAMEVKKFSYGMRKYMNELFKKGMVSHENILRHYNLKAHYGISSLWLGAVYSKHFFLDRRYSLLTKSSAVSIKDIPAGEFYNWRPLRLFTLWNYISWPQKGIPAIEGYVLSPLEYELILLCSGKLQLKQIIDIITEKFTGIFENREEAEEFVSDLLTDFEKRHWIVFSRY